ncbi:MAG: polysaccharide deacetylase family protein [Reyranellaceae bacterium]
MYFPGSLGGWCPVVWRQAPGVTDVALTFDDGPHPETTPAILDLLRHHDATATFFFSGVRAAASPDLVAQAVAAGHAAYAHGWDHVDHERVGSADSAVACLQRAELLLSAFRPTPDPYLVRLPFNAGMKRQRFHRSLRRFRPRARFAWWTISAQDWRLAEHCADPAELARRCGAVASTLAGRRDLPGSIVLLHEAPFGATGPLVPRIAPELLRAVLAMLRARGLRAGPLAPPVPRAHERYFWWHPGADRLILPPARV